ncbi:MAG: OadG family protein [Oscillibacter sp.]|nr:OadG family protein [Oscillibacter sp.]
MDYPSVLVICMGLGTVFFGLTCLIALTTIMGRVLSQRLTVAPAGVPVVPAAAAPLPTEPDRTAMAAAVAAAIAEELGTDITGLRILSMKKI